MTDLHQERNVRTFLLDKELVQAQHIIPRSHWIQSHNPRILVEERLDELIVNVEAEVLAGNPVYIEWRVRYPSSWWQHFKKEVMVPLTRNPSTSLGKRLYQWACRWGSKTEGYKRTINRKVCPHLDIPPSHRAHVEWLTTDSP